MVGRQIPKNILDNTLLFICDLLNKHNIKDWFICYGTLLGIIRENGCINNDDDIDIITSKKNYEKILKIIKDNGFQIERRYGVDDSKDIIKTKEVIINNVTKYASIDIYMADIKGNDVYDIWNKIKIKDCYMNKFQTIKWKNKILYLPYNSKKILKNRYGNSWNIPLNKKIEQTMNEI
jgi:phosphorylcholine metabolism protein LicD